MGKGGFAKLADKLREEEPDRIKQGRAALAKRVRDEEEEAPKHRADDEAMRQILAVLEAGYLGLAADGEVHEAEISHIGENLARWIGQDINADDLAGLLDGFSRSLEKQGLEARLDYLAEQLDPDLRRVAFDLAAAVSAADGFVTEEELG